jgi:hypothetical protein
MPYKVVAKYLYLDDFGKSHFGECDESGKSLQNAGLGATFTIKIDGDVREFLGHICELDIKMIKYKFTQPDGVVREGARVKLLNISIKK